MIWSRYPTASMTNVGGRVLINFTAENHLSNVGENFSQRNSNGVLFKENLLRRTCVALPLKPKLVTVDQCNFSETRADRAWIFNRIWKFRLKFEVTKLTILWALVYLWLVDWSTVRRISRYQKQYILILVGVYTKVYLTPSCQLIPAGAGWARPDYNLRCR